MTNTGSKYCKSQLPVFCPALWAVVLLAAWVICGVSNAAAVCVEKGVSTYRKGYTNQGSYEGSPGDICDTIIGGSDPAVSTGGGADPKGSLAGSLELGPDGWRYIFANTPPGTVETFTIVVAHQSGVMTTFKITARRR